MKELCISKQRPVILNHNMVQGQWDTYQTRNDRENKVRADAQKEVDKEAVGVLKNLQKEQAREIERKRKTSLTKAQLVE